MGEREVGEVSEITQSERLIFILMLLSENRHPFSVAQIHEKVSAYGADVDERTIRRDIDLLSGIAFITEETVGKTTYYSCGKFNLTGLTFDGKDLVTLSFLKSLTKEYGNTQLGKDAEKFIDRIVEHTGGMNAGFLSDFAKAFSFNEAKGNRKADVNPDFEGILSEAIGTHTKVKMTYKAFGAEKPTERVFHPYEFFMQEGNLSVIGYCELRGCIREFRLSRIQTLTPLDESFTKDPAYMPKGGERFLSLMGKEREEVELTFSKEIAPFILEYEKGRADKIETNCDGTVTFTVKAAITDDLVRWVLSYTGDVLVKKPYELCEIVTEKITKSKV